MEQLLKVFELERKAVAEKYSLNILPNKQLPFSFYQLHMLIFACRNSPHIAYSFLLVLEANLLL
jgi:hypothetical protein